MTGGFYDKDMVIGRWCFQDKYISNDLNMNKGGEEWRGRNYAANANLICRDLQNKSLTKFQ